MPIYNIQGPDGRIYSLEGPEGATEDQVINALKANLSGQGIGSLPAPTPEGGFIPSVKRGFAQTGILLGDILPAMAGRLVGADEYAERQFKEAAETERKIQELYPATVPSYKDIKGVGDAATYLIESVGELVPSILPSLFTGGAAGVIGRGATIAAKEAAEAEIKKRLVTEGAEALAKEEVAKQIRDAGIKAAMQTAAKYQAVGAVTGSALQNVPEVYKNIKDETKQESLGASLLFGGLNSVLDAALPLSLLAKVRKADIPTEQIVGAWYKRFGVGAAKGFATEGATEAAQEMSSAAAEKFVDENQEFFSEKNLERFLNAGLKGGLGGGVVSGTTDVMLGKRSLTEDLKPLDEDIRNTQSDILARRALLNELRAQADEEGKNKLDAEALKDLGFGAKYSLYDTLLNKDINDPAQAQEVIGVLQTAISDPATKGRERVVAANTLDVINQYLETRGEPDVGQVVEEPSGAGVSVPEAVTEPAPAEGVGGVEPTGVVPPVADVGAPVGGEGLAPAPVEPAPVAAAPVAPVAPVETAPAPTITAPPAPPVIEPAAVAAAPVETAAAPAAVPPAPPVTEPPVETVPTTRELIAQQETELAAQMDKFQNLLQQQVQRFGLKDVGVKVVDDLVNANAQYSKGLIKLAVDAADPVRDLRHESVHALKELGFFTPNQWDALVRRANESWINTYLRNRDIDGNFIEPGKESRYDAYVSEFKKQGLNDAQMQEALVEEAISDAFGDFNQTKAPPGMMQAILNRMKNFFRSIKEAVGLAEVDPETLFGRIERAELAAPVDKTAAKQYPPEEKAASAKERVGEPERQAKPSLARIKQVPTAGRPEPTGDRGGRDQGRSLAPLDGAPVVSEATGPDPRIVRVAEDYAKSVGIPLERQPTYVDVDEDRAKRIAQAYEDMPHAPQDPAVKEAYADMIRQTRAQYDALVDAGYEFTFFDSNTDPYGGNPWNAMRDLRKNKRMAVYGTYDGYGTEGITGAAVEDNPMLADTGLRWKDQGGVEHMVTANDLFRAVHDAFGHGMEGAGFRARGEENAWQAHARLFTGPALGALTSETRGQNSWLNYGPYGEKNRTAKLEDTVFAQQKTGLMPEWTWQEGLTKEKPVADRDTKLSLRIMRGQEVPKIEGRITVDKIGKYFDDQIKADFGRALDYNNPEDFARALKIANEEVDYQLKQEKSGLDWYEDDVRLAFEDTAKVIPQLENAENRVLFSVIAGIMSPQTTARDNWFIAAKAYQHYVETGNVPGVNPETNKLWQGGTTSVNKRIQLEFLDRMIKDMGQTNAVNWLLSDHTVKEINGFRQKYGNIKSGIDGKLNDTRRGLFAFGPKVGPFVSNLNGIHDVTVDQWMIRTFNRYFGTMIGPDGQIVDAPTEPQRRAVKDLVNKAAEDANIKPYQVQSLLWFYEQRLYDKIGLPTKSYGFSDGGKRFLEEAGGRVGKPSVRPAAAPTEEVTPKYSISGKRITDTPELREAAKKSAIVDADGNLIPMYHGTAALIRIFRGKQAGATFLSPDPEFAAGFTSASRDWMVRHIGQFLKPDEIRKAVQELRQAVYAEYGKQSKMTSKIMDEIYEVLQDAKETGVYRFKGELQDMWTPIAFSKIPGAKERVMELYVLAKNPFDFDSKDSVNKVIKQMLTDPEVKRQYGYSPAPAGVDLQKPENFMLRQTLERTDKEFKAAVEEKFKDNISRGSWRAIETPEVQRAIRKLNFDSFYVIEGGTKNLGVYDPKLIKSADENFGPFGQRPPTEEEAKAAELTLEDAIKAQEEGDIRFSLRAHKDLFDRADEIPMSEGVEAIRDDWVGGVAGVGNRDSMYALFRIEGGSEYTREVQKFLRNNLGENFKGYRLMSQNEFEELTTGSMGSQFVSFSLNPDVAKGFKNLPAYAKRKDLVVIEMDLTPEHIHMIGHPGEQELVVDYGQGYNPAEIKVIEGDVGRKSLRSSVDPAINARILQTTTAREEKTFPQRITQALGPETYSRFRAAALNRYNSLGVADKQKAKMMGGIELLADSNAESAALVSDLAAGIVAGALGVYDKVGGVPVYNRHYVVERAIQGPRGTQFIQVGGKIQSRQAAEALARRFPDAAVRERGYTAVTNLNNTVKGPLAIFAPLAKLGNPDAYRAYQYWAGVKRGSKWMTNPNGQVVEQLFEKADIPKAEKLRQEYLAQGVDFNQIQKEWTAYNDQLVKYMLDTGVISKENAKKFTEHGDYLPFYRQINGDDDAVGPRIFQAISSVKAPRKIKGGEDPLGDFLENMVRNTQAAVQAGLKNVAARRAADVGMDVGTVRPITQAQASPLNSFYVLENGQKVFYDTDDLLFIDSIKSLGLPDFPGIGLLSGPAGVLRNLVTKDPGFMLANMMRDSLAAWTTSGVNMLPVAATLKNFTNALAGTSPEYKALLMSGVVGGYDYSQGTQDAAKQFGKELRKTAGARTVGEKALTPFTSLWEGLEKGTQASDAATRIEVYKQTLKDTGNEAEALFRALEVMNFNRKGNNPIVRVATAAIPFLNARMQGLDVLYRAAFGKNTTSNAQAIQKAFWVRGMTMAALSSMYWLLTHDDDEYKKQEQETRDNNWLFPSLGIKVPIPFEVGVLFKVIPERIMGLTFGDDTAKDFTKSMARNLASTLAVNPIPQTILPLVEATTNYSFFTFRPIVGQGLEGVASGYQVSPGTSRLAEGLGGVLNISPMKIDQVIQGYTGTIGTYMSQLIDSIYDLHADNPKASLRFEQMPVFKRFLIDPDARGQVTAYYDLKNSVDEATRTANLLEKSMNWEEWGKYYSENIGMFAVKDYVRDMEKTMKEFREMKNMIRIMPMSADEKRDNLLAITQMENQLVSNIQTLKKQMQ